MPAIRTLTETLDTLYTTTWELRKGGVFDQIFGATPFWHWMKSKGKFKKQRGHRYITEPLQYDTNDNIYWLTKGGTVNLNQYEFLTTSKWDWKYLVGSMVRFGVDDQQNSGKAQIINLMNATNDNTLNSLISELETKLAGTVTGNSILGLQRLVPDDPTASVSVGTINQNTYSWWRNQESDLTGLSFSVYGVSYMRTLLNDCMNNLTMDSPDIILCAQTPYEYYEDEAVEQKQIVNKTLGDAGFIHIQYKGLPMIWSPQISSRMYFLNTRFLYFIYDPALNFDMTAWKDIPDQVNDRAAQIVLACAFIVSRRLCQGVLHTIDTA